MISVIIPTLWKPEGFLERLFEISKIQSVGEIVLIDNDASKNVDLSHIPKVVHVKEPQNLYVIPSWNKGVSLAKYDKLLIVNDDVETDWEILNSMADHITPDKGMIGASIKCWHTTDTRTEVSPIHNMPNCYACFFFIHKESYQQIPESMKVHYGDNWLFDAMLRKGKSNYEICEWMLGGESEQTSGLAEFNAIKQLDGVAYGNSLGLNTCIFTTHTTLNIEHAEHSLKSLLALQTQDITWDNFIIYNTHEHELSNEKIIELIEKYDSRRYIKDLLIFPYDQETNKKNLLQDIRNWYDVGLSLELQKSPGKMLWLKSDYCVSSNFNKVLLEHRNNNFMWSLPTLSAKERVNYDSILQKLNIVEFTPTDSETYYRGGDNSNNNLPKNEISPNGEMDFHPSINYVSHNYVHDFNLHVVSNDTLQLGRDIAYHPQVFDMDSTWGGPHNLFYGLKQNGVHFSGEYRAYGIHMFHEIISENRLQDRGDDRKLHKGERY